MEIIRTLGVAVFGTLLAYYVGTVFIVTMITGTSTGDLMIQSVLPLALAAFAIIVFIMVGFGRRRPRE